MLLIDYAYQFDGLCIKKSLSDPARDRYHVKQIINRLKFRNERTSKPEGIIALGLFASIVERSKGRVMTN